MTHEGLFAQVGGFAVRAAGGFMWDNEGGPARVNAGAVTNR